MGMRGERRRGRGLVSRRWPVPAGKAALGWGLMALVLLGMIAGCATPATREVQAIELVPGEPRDGWLGPGVDVYAFTLTAPAKVRLESETPASGWTLDPDATLFDAKGRVVARDWRSGEGENFRLTRSLPAGRWYLEVSDGGGCTIMADDCEAHRRYSVRLDVEPGTP
ncbi:pre-peptidase C-terminal domain-containing protein [Onishia taeanensis]|uniref:Pre-peptidase C-terminal domain-containing protein n=1 Tax=Onishia taeanensis TaxID=284577 RepID=A0A1G7V3I7_9GAMM|nr:pre-peptidase C-terminal domain-containing protein [Halomonas taeanensis]